MIYADSGLPHGIAVAVFAYIRGADVVGTLAGCNGAIMTTGTVGEDRIMIKISRHPGIRRMAVVTGIRAGNVQRIFALCCHAIVTTGTGTQHLEVIDLGHGCPDIGAVTVLANLSRADMLWIFAHGPYAVMAAVTTVGNTGVVKGRGHPGIGAVAVVTGFRTGNVVVVFALGNHSVMAADAGANNLEVINFDDRFPHAGAVTGFTSFRAVDVIRTFAGGRNAIMATGTIPGNSRVVKKGRHPGIGRMAQFTGFAGLQVISWFSCRLIAIMAALTATQYLAMVEADHRCPPGFKMAVLTLIGGLNMIQWRGSCLHQATLTVTAGTFFRSSLKHTANMAGGAVRCTMRSFQGKSGCEMIKICLER